MNNHIVSLRAFFAKQSKGFVLIEAIACVIIMSISLTLIVAALATQARATKKINDQLISTLAMANVVADTYDQAWRGQSKSFSNAPELEIPYQQFQLNRVVTKTLPYLETMTIEIFYNAQDKKIIANKLVMWLPKIDGVTQIKTYVPSY